MVAPNLYHQRAVCMTCKFYTFLRQTGNIQQDAKKFSIDKAVISHGFYQNIAVFSALYLVRLLPSTTICSSFISNSSTQAC